MSNMNGSAKKLWIILTCFALALALALATEYFHPETPDNHEDISAGDASNNESGEDGDTVKSSDTPVSTTVATDFTLTFLGECAPGSPYGTKAFGSLNALAAEQGLSYFFSEITDFLSEDDLTVLANSCLFHDSLSAECSAPTAQASVYADASVEMVANLSPHLDEHAVHAAVNIQSTGVHVSKDGSVESAGNEHLSIKILSVYVTEDSADNVIEQVSSAAKTTEYLILYFYGGEINSHTSESWLTDTMHACVDAGASLIVGCGTGVLRPVETYNGVTIAYSLGTLIDGTQLISENATAMMRCTVRKSSNGKIETDISFHPCYVFTDLWKPALMTDAEDADLVTRFLAGEAQMPIKVPMPIEE